MTFKSKIASALAVGALASAAPFVLQGGNAMAGPTKVFNSNGGQELKNPHAAVAADVERRGQHIEVATRGLSTYLREQRGLDDTDLLAAVTEPTVISEREISFMSNKKQTVVDQFLHNGFMSQALTQMKASGKAQVFGAGANFGDSRLEYGVSVRPDGSTLFVARERETARGPYQTLFAVDIDASGKAKDITNKVDLKEFGLSDPAQGRLPKEPRQAFTPAATIRPAAGLGHN